MLAEKVIIRQIPDDYAEATGLAKYNRSRMPRCFDRFSPALGRDGRFITGLDELALSVTNIQDDELREKKKKEVKHLRESLERLTGENLDGTSSFWEQFSVEIRSDVELVLNRSNPRDVIKYNLLVSNNYAAPSKEETGNPIYKDCKYFVFTAERDNKEKVSVRKLKDKARAELLKIADKQEYMLMLGQFLEGKKYTKSLEPDTLYTMLSDFIESKKENAVEKFLEAVNKDKKEIQFKLVVDKAIQARLIKFNDGYYQRGQVTLGKTHQEVYLNLSTPEFATEFISLRDELQKSSLS
jgi:hypothetical protein